MKNGLLVRIYPIEGLGEPVELRDDCLLIGRDGPCTLVVDDDSVSRRHAKIERVAGKHMLIDLRSLNGTFVNEERITEVELRAGDRIRLGKQIFKFLTTDELESQYHEVVFKMVTTDGLTQVYNKRFFLEALERELNFAKRCDATVSVMMMDLDKFKSVNDTFGHLAGDAVLVEFAKRAKSVLRSGELLARFGGEEFALLCNHATVQDVAAAAERIRSVIAAEPVLFDHQVIPMTVSIGISSTKTDGSTEPEKLLAQADYWLYQAKSAGRNQVQFSESSIPQA
jgi:diguanylate cyclase (GGDEF)-like protein